MSVLGDWLGRPWERDTCSIYFRESKLQMWSSLTDFLEDTLKSVRKQLSPLFKELQKNISARIIGKNSRCFSCSFIMKVLCNWREFQGRKGWSKCWLPYLFGKTFFPLFFISPFKVNDCPLTTSIFIFKMLKLVPFK